MALATIVAVRGSTYRRPGARLLVPEEGAPIGNLSGGGAEGHVQGSLGPADADAEAIVVAHELLAEQRSEIRTLVHGVRAFVEVLEPPLRLLVCGAGHDAVPLVRAASVIGWKAIVVDDRE